MTHDGKWAFVSRRTANKLAVIDLEDQTFTDCSTLSLPDTLELSANEKLLTVGLRTSPATDGGRRYADLRLTSSSMLSPSGGATTIAGHQWTSPNGRYTFAAFEGGTSPGLSVIDHRAGNQVIQTLAYPGRPHGVDRARP